MPANVYPDLFIELSLISGFWRNKKSIHVILNHWYVHRSAKSKCNSSLTSSNVWAWECVCAIRQSANAFRALKLADAIYLRHSKIFWTIDGHRWSHHTADNEKLMTLCRPNITNVHWWKQVNGERVRIHAVEIHTRARANIHCDNVWLCGGGV